MEQGANMNMNELLDKDEDLKLAFYEELQQREPDDNHLAELLKQRRVNYAKIRIELDSHNPSVLERAMIRDIERELDVAPSMENVYLK
jgi:hypothetical protein